MALCCCAKSESSTCFVPVASGPERTASMASEEKQNPEDYTLLAENPNLKQNSKIDYTLIRAKSKSETDFQNPSLN